MVQINFCTIFHEKDQNNCVHSIQYVVILIYKLDGGLNMWDQEAIEMHVAYLTDHERLVLEAIYNGYMDIKTVKDYVRFKANFDPDFDYIEAVFNQETHVSSIRDETAL